MFLSVSGHSSELSIANHSSRPTVSQLKCVSDTVSNWFENHQPQKTKISTVSYAPFIQNSNQMAFRLTATTSFPRVFFQLLQFSRRRPSISAHMAALMTRTDLIFPAFSFFLSPETLLTNFWDNFKKKEGRGSPFFHGIHSICCFFSVSLFYYCLWLLFVSVMYTYMTV